MTTKDLAQRWFEEIWNRKNREAIHGLMEPGAVGCTEGGMVVGPDAFIGEMFETLTTAFPDLHLRIDGIVAEGDEAAVRWRASATHAGRLGNLEPTGRKVRFAGMTWLKFRDGRVVEGCDRWNLHALMQYLATGEEAATVKAAT